ncbi:sigma-E processing peptidase SpoIIGA [Virgibacillus sp. MSJ-26]|uniref:sigma-E processing peptidase SpoIIGA n=1 Tax=Virgibacillus sp. MSJ-26 TaxID=2841522 RepID=UPI001C122B2A|nr:sigma-E processing peptidase SpoIIGA [Virgibacillus sp. MSJ-26]
MTIYLDAVWALNYFLDLMLLMLTGAMVKERVTKRRLLFGAFVASLIVPLSLYFPNTFLTSIVGKLLYSLLIVFCTFRFISIHRTLKLLLIFYFITFAIGGGLIALHHMAQSPVGMSDSGILTFSKGYGDPVSWLFILIGFPFVWLFTKRRLDKHAVEKIRYDQLYRVTLKMNGRTFSTDGYIDSGNQLVCPMTKKPVVIADQSFLKQWFAEVEWKQLKESHASLDFDNIPKAWEDSIHVVPYQGVEGGSNFLLALRPEKLTIQYDEDEIITNNVLIGIQFDNLTTDHLYHCLLQPEIIKLSNINTA